MLSTEIRGLEVLPSICLSAVIWTTFFNKEPLSLTHFRNSICGIGFPMQERAFMEDPEIVAPHCKM